MGNCPSCSASGGYTISNGKIISSSDDGNIATEDLEKLLFVALMDTSRFHFYSKNFLTQALNNLKKMYTSIFTEFQRLKNELQLIYSDDQYHTSNMEPHRLMESLFENSSIFNEAYKLLCLIVTIPSTTLIEETTEPDSMITEDVKLRNDTKITTERRQAIFSEIVKFDEKDDIKLPTHPKSTDKIISGTRLDDVVPAFYMREVSAKDTIIKQGDEGRHMYISISGKFQIIVNGKIEEEFDDVWVLDSNVYQKITQKHNIKEEDEIMQFLLNNKTLSVIGKDALQIMSTLLKTEHFLPGQVIVKQGDKGKLQRVLIFRILPFILKFIVICMISYLHSVCLNFSNKACNSKRIFLIRTTFDYIIACLLNYYKRIYRM
nr:unnamed protein product [Callosobruchus analis]